MFDFLIKIFDLVSDIDLFSRMVKLQIIDHVIKKMPVEADHLWPGLNQFPAPAPLK